MKETAVQVNARQIRNGIRKQAAVIQREKDKVWDRLKDDGKPPKWTEKIREFGTWHGLDFEQEIADALTAEILAENPTWEEKLKKDVDDLMQSEYIKSITK